MEDKGGGKFLPGFILGAIIGAGIVFLFGTKKGKKLLKLITEEGIGNFSDLLEEEEDIKEYNESKSVEVETKKETNDSLKTETNGENKKPQVHRFFRRTPR